MNGLSDQEIADKLSMQVASVNRQKNRLKKRLSQEIANLRYEIESC
jgi:DNA-binding CsgD family transcriptional regulator